MATNTTNADLRGAAPKQSDVPSEDLSNLSPIDRAEKMRETLMEKDNVMEFRIPTTTQYKVNERTGIGAKLPPFSVNGVNFSGLEVDKKYTLPKQIISMICSFLNVHDPVLTDKEREDEERGKRKKERMEASQYAGE